MLFGGKRALSYRPSPAQVPAAGAKSESPRHSSRYSPLSVSHLIAPTASARIVQPHRQRGILERGANGDWHAGPPRPYSERMDNAGYRVGEVIVFAGRMIDFPASPAKAEELLLEDRHLGKAHLPRVQPRFERLVELMLGE